MRSWLSLPASAICVLCLSAIASCCAPSQQADSPVVHPATPTSSTLNKIMTDDKLFENVPFNTNKQTACSPAEPGIDWLGVKVRAPSQVFMPDKDAPHLALIMPLCGVYFMNVAKAIRHPGPLMLIVTDIATGKTYRGPIIDRDPHPRVPPPPSPPLNPADFEDQDFGNYFNFDVATYVALPLQTARYRVKVEWHGYESNEVSIAVVQRP
jgi:hypothetical protein